MGLAPLESGGAGCGIQAGHLEFPSAPLCFTLWAGWNTVSVRHMFTLVQTQQDGQTDVLTKPAPVPLSLAVLSLWMFVQEQFNGTALWGTEESWAGVIQLHVLHCIFFSLCKAHGTLQLGKRHSSAQGVTAAG